MRFALDMCYALDMPCGASGIDIISNCEAIYRFCNAKISSRASGISTKMMNRYKSQMGFSICAIAFDMCFALDMPGGAREIYIIR